MVWPMKWWLSSLGYCWPWASWRGQANWACNLSSLGTVPPNFINIDFNIPLTKNSSGCWSATVGGIRGSETMQEISTSTKKYFGNCVVGCCLSHATLLFFSELTTWTHAYGCWERAILRFQPIYDVYHINIRWYRISYPHSTLSRAIHQPPAAKYQPSNRRSPMAEGTRRSWRRRAAKALGPRLRHRMKDWGTIWYAYINKYIHAQRKMDRQR